MGEVRFYGTTVSSNDLTGELEIFSNYSKERIYKGVIKDHKLRIEVEKAIRAAEKEALFVAGLNAEAAIKQLHRDCL